MVLKESKVRDEAELESLLKINPNQIEEILNKTMV